MSWTLPIGGTQSGGTNKVMQFAGMANGVASYVSPDHTILAKQSLTVSISNANATDKKMPTAETRFVFSSVNTSSEEGCCSNVVGGSMFDLKMRWNLNQPQTSVDDTLKYLQGLVFSAEFKNALVKGLYPQA